MTDNKNNKKNNKLSVPDFNDSDNENNESNSQKLNIFDHPKTKGITDISNKKTPKETKKATTAVKPKKTTTAVNPKKTTAAVKPKKTTVAVKPKKTTAAVKPKKTTETKKTTKNTKISTKFLEKVTTRPKEISKNLSFLSKFFVFKKNDANTGNSNQEKSKVNNATDKKTADSKAKKTLPLEQQEFKLEDSVGQNDPCYTDSRAFGVMQELIKEQRSQRRWRLFRNYFFVLIVASLLFSCLFEIGDDLETMSSIYQDPAAFHESKNFITYEHIAVIPLKGIIADGDLGTNAMDFHKLLKKAFQNPAVKTIFIDANSSGGSPVQSALMFDAIARLKSEYSKPIYAIVADVCASGCYYAIVGADKIFVNASSILGSIGVRLESFDLRGLMEKAGVEQRLITAGENKALLNPFGELPDSQREHLQELIDKTHIEFIDAVIEGRGKKIDVNNSTLFSGLIWNGRESIKLGLADGLGDLISISKTLGIDTLEYYKPYRGFLGELLELVNGFRFNTQQHLKAKLD